MANNTLFGNTSLLGIHLRSFAHERLIPERLDSGYLYVDHQTLKDESLCLVSRFVSFQAYRQLIQLNNSREGIFGLANWTTYRAY